MKKTILLNALIWAAVLLIVMYFVKGTPYEEWIFFTLIMASSLQMALLNGLNQSKNKKKIC